MDCSADVISILTALGGHLELQAGIPTAHFCSLGRFRLSKRVVSVARGDVVPGVGQLGQGASAPVPYQEPPPPPPPPPPEKPPPPKPLEPEPDGVETMVPLVVTAKLSIESEKLATVKG